MKSALTCEQVAADLSAFTDQALPASRRDEIARHLVGCDRCRAEAGELRRVRALLASSTASAVPEPLSERLVGIGGAEVSSPLWMRQGQPGPTILPSPRAIRRRRIGRSVTATALCVALVAALGLLLAPAEVRITNARQNAVVEYELATGAGAAVGAIAAVMALGNSGLLTEVADPSSQILQPPTQVWTQVNADVATALLQLASAAQAFSGRELVMLGGVGGDRGARAQVTMSAEQGMVVQVFDDSADVLWQGHVATSGTWLAGALAATGRSFRVGDGGVVAGFTTEVLESLSARGTLLHRWWLATQIGMVLASQTWDGQGNLVSAGHFTEVTLGEPAHPLTSPVTLSLAPVGASSEVACAPGFTCASQVAGYSLLRMSVDQPAHPSVVRADYGSGSSVVTVMQRQGILDESATDATWGSSGELSIQVWQSGDVVYTVASRDGTAARELAAALPHDPVAEHHLWTRVGEGLKRLVGQRGG